MYGEGIVYSVQCVGMPLLTQWLTAGVSSGGLGVNLRCTRFLQGDLEASGSLGSKWGE